MKRRVRTNKAWFRLGGEKGRFKEHEETEERARRMQGVGEDLFCGRLTVRSQAGQVAGGVGVAIQELNHDGARRRLCNPWLSFGSVRKRQVHYFYAAKGRGEKRTPIIPFA